VPCADPLSCQPTIGLASGNARPGNGACCMPAPTCQPQCVAIADATGCQTGCVCTTQSPTSHPTLQPTNVNTVPTVVLSTISANVNRDGSGGPSSSPAYDDGIGDGGGSGGGGDAASNTPIMAATIVAAVLLVAGLIVLRVRHRRSVSGAYDVTSALAGIQPNPLASMTTSDPGVNQAIRQRMLLSTAEEHRLHVNGHITRASSGTTTAATATGYAKQRGKSCTAVGAVVVANAAFVDPRLETAAKRRGSAPTPTPSVRVGAARAVRVSSDRATDGTWGDDGGGYLTVEGTTHAGEYDDDDDGHSIDDNENDVGGNEQISLRAAAAGLTGFTFIGGKAGPAAPAKVVLWNPEVYVGDGERAAYPVSRRNDEHVATSSMDDIEV
jgi:hypothetical protein